MIGADECWIAGPEHLHSKLRVPKPNPTRNMSGGNAHFNHRLCGGIQVSIEFREIEEYAAMVCCSLVFCDLCQDLCVDFLEHMILRIPRFLIKLDHEIVDRRTVLVMNPEYDMLEAVIPCGVLAFDSLCKGLVGQLLATL